MANTPDSAMQQALAEQEAKLRAKYGDVQSAKRQVLAKKLSNKKRNFDSADWALSKSRSPTTRDSQDSGHTTMPADESCDAEKSPPPAKDGPGGQ